MSALEFLIMHVAADNLTCIFYLLKSANMIIYLQHYKCSYARMLVDVIFLSFYYLSEVRAT